MRSRGTWPLAYMRASAARRCVTCFPRTPVPPDLQAMFPSGVSVRCYDCASLSQVRVVFLPLVLVWFKCCRAVAMLRFGLRRYICVILLAQVSWHFFGMKCSSCGRQALFSFRCHVASTSRACSRSFFLYTPCSYNTNPDG